MKKEKRDDNKKGLAAAEIAGGGLAAKILFDDGYIDGRTTLYHGTSEESAKKIKQEGLKAKYTGVGSPTSKSITDILPEDIVNKSKGHSFLDKKRFLAAHYAAQHRGDGKRSTEPSGEVIKDWFKHFVGTKKGVVKARVPLWDKKTIKNPETYGSYEEWEKNLPFGGAFFTDAQKKTMYKVLDDAVVVKGDISPELIKGNKYRRIGLDEYKRFISKNKGKAAIGAAGGLLATGLIGKGIYDSVGEAKKS